LERRDHILVSTLAALGVLGVLLVGRQAGTPLGFPLDDAWIHMVYGRSLATEGLLAYNAGVAASGCTAPLWTLVVAAVHLVAGHLSTRVVVSLVLFIGAGLHVETVRQAAALAARIAGHKDAGLVTGAALALSAPLVVGGLSGMEVSFCGLLLVFAVRALWEENWTWSGILLALSIAARPEAAVPAALCAGLALHGRWARWRVLRLALPSLVLGALIVGHALYATGRPLPATFYFKQEAGLAELPGRLATAVTAMLDRVPPLWGYVGWLALSGLFLRPLSSRRLLPVAGGLGFLLANLMVARPVDPEAFYHLRYVLPAVPLLTVALAVGAARLGRWPLLLLLTMVTGGAIFTFAPTSQRYHNDVRNINEVQVAMGRWLDENLPAEARVAATDAGAVRYFGNRPVVDLMGLNTPEFYWEDGWAAAHPVDVLAIMPAWVQPVDPAALTPYRTYRTVDYSVTSYPAMARQVIAGVPAGAGPVRVRCRGLRSFELDVRPWRPFTPR